MEIVGDREAVRECVGVGEGDTDGVGLGLAMTYTYPPFDPMYARLLEPITTELVVATGSVKFHISVPVTPFKATTLLSVLATCTVPSAPIAGVDTLAFLKLYLHTTLPLEFIAYTPPS